MLSSIKQVIIGALILMALPIAALCTGWNWQPSGNSLYLYICYLITETASYPWAGISCVILALWMVWLLKLSIKKSCQLIVVLAIAVVFGQVVKSVIKESVEEPRPFVIWLEKEYNIDDEYFYDLPRKQRAEIVHEQLVNDARVPVWLKTHWQNETGYAFPSGHTLFTVTWALIAIVLLWSRKHYATVTILMIWAIIVMASRLVLGMHWPTDLILATILSSFVAILTNWVCCRYIFPPGDQTHPE